METSRFVVTVVQQKRSNLLDLRVQDFQAGAESDLTILLRLILEGTLGGFCLKFMEPLIVPTLNTV